MSARIAVESTVTSIGFAIDSVLPVVNEVIQIVAGLVAIISGVFAAWHYWKRIRSLK